MSLELGEQLSEGAGHKVYRNPRNPGTLIKVPRLRNRLRGYDKAARDLEAAETYFSPWMAPTSIYPYGKGYFLEQELVQNAAHIKPANLESTPTTDELEEILEANRKAMKDGKVGLDFLGFEGSAKSFLRKMKKFKGTSVDSLVITPSLKLAHYLRPGSVPGRSLEWWNDPDLTPEITNLLIGTRQNTNRQIAVVDLTLLRFGNASRYETTRSRFLQRWNRKYLKRDFGLDID